MASIYSPVSSYLFHKAFGRFSLNLPATSSTPKTMDFSLVFLSFVHLISSTSAFNITRILNNQSDFSTFNSLLSQTNLASEINARQTITVLVVDNGAISTLSGRTPDVQKDILSVHVILDYYDKEKLMASSKKSRLVTTLFQSSGIATNQQGFINITIDKSSGAIRLGSAVPGSTLDASVVDEVVTRPYNISVLHISNLILPPGIDKLKSPPPSKSPAKAPSKSPTKAPSPADSPAEAPAPVADGPEADSPSHAHESAEAPAADGPSADGPSSGGADGPSADGPDADGSGASAARVSLGTILGVIVGVVCMAFR